MGKPILLFPGSYMDYHLADDDMKEEYEAAKNTELFKIVLFNYDEWLAGDRLKLTAKDEVSGRGIYRGWMLKPEEYEKLYIELLKRDIELITAPNEYENMHLFPNVYPHIKEDTARMMVFEDGKVDVEKAKKQFDRFMVKDSVKSVKGTEFPLYFDQTVTQEEFDKWMKVFYKYRGDLLTGGICIKEFLDLKRYDNKTNEYRAFYAGHRVISVSRNSNQPAFSLEPPIELIDKYKDLDSPYYTVDFAELVDGSWKIIEAGDGSVSGLSPKQDATSYYRALYFTFTDSLKRAVDCAG